MAELQYKLGEMWAIPVEGTYYTITSTNTLNGIAPALYQATICGNGSTADVNLKFFTESIDLADFINGTSTITISQSVAGASVEIMSFEAPYFTQEPYDHIVGYDATELKLSTATFRNVNFIMTGTFAKYSGKNATMTFTLNQQIDAIPEYSNQPPAGSYFFTNARGVTYE